MVAYNEVYGTSGDDVLTGYGFTVAYGFQGHDTFETQDIVEYQLLFGGEGNDDYYIGRGHVGTVVDFSGDDWVYLDGIYATSGFTTHMLVDGRHLIVWSVLSETMLWLMDFWTSSVSRLIFEDGYVLTADLRDGSFVLPNYRGDSGWDYLNQNGFFNAPSEFDVDIVYPQIIEAEARYSQALLVEGLTSVEARTVAYLYEAGLDRNGNIDLPGLNFWIDLREAGFAEKDLAWAFLSSNEFEAAFGAPETLSDRELVEQLYWNVLDRQGEAAGVDFWEGVLGQPGYDRADLLLAFALSPENVAGSPFVEDLAEVAPGEWAFL